MSLNSMSKIMEIIKLEVVASSGEVGGGAVGTWCEGSRWHR